MPLPILLFKSSRAGEVGQAEGPNQGTTEGGICSKAPAQNYLNHERDSRDQDCEDGPGSIVHGSFSSVRILIRTDFILCTSKVSMDGQATVSDEYHQDAKHCAQDNSRDLAVLYVDPDEKEALDRQYRSGHRRQHRI